MVSVCSVTLKATRNISERLLLLSLLRLRNFFMPCPSLATLSSERCFCSEAMECVRLARGFCFSFFDLFCLALCACIAACTSSPSSLRGALKAAWSSSLGK